MNLLALISFALLMGAFTIRCFRVPRLEYRRALWCASTVLHGILLALCLVMALGTEWSEPNVGNGLAWFVWLAAPIGLSVYGLRNDNHGGA